LKKLITDSNGQIPIYSDDLSGILQNEIYTASLAHLKSLSSTTPLIINGCDATLSGSDVTITSGYIYINNEIIPFNGYTGAYPVYISQGTNAITTRVFKDGSTNPAVIETSTTTSLTIPTDSYIVFDPYTSQRYSDVLSRYSTKKGQIIEVALFDITSKFDGTGLGKWEWYGYALCNGNNGTPNLNGRVTIGDGTYTETGFSHSYTYGENGGKAGVKLTGAQSGIKDHNHDITQTPHHHGITSAETGWYYRNASDGGGGNYFGSTPTAFPFSVNTSNGNANISINNTGNVDADDYHENRQPFYAVKKIIRII
jgi:hypothetical protein